MDDNTYSDQSLDAETSAGGDVTQPAPAQPGQDDAQRRRNTVEEVRKWLARRTVAEKYREQVATKFRWKDFVNQYKGQFVLTNGQVDIQINPLNFPFAYIKTEIPALSLRDPKIKVNPKRAGSIESAKILEVALNYLWRSKKVKRQNTKNIVDAKTVGHSWFKTGYTGKTGTVEIGNGLTIETIDSEDFFGYRVPWDCITFSPGSIDPPHDCAWICHDVWAPMEDVKANPRYKNTDQLKAQTKRPVYNNNVNNAEIPNDFDEPMVCLYEFWDMKNQRVFTLSNGVDAYLEEPKPWPYEMKGFPFSYLSFNPINDEPYGIPDIYMFEPQVIEIMKIRAMELDHLKRFNRQIITTPSNLSPEQKDSFMLGVTGNVVEALEPEKVFPVPYPPIQQDAYAVEERLKEDMINISGQSPQERGGTQKTSTRSFSELELIAQGAKNRRADQVDTFEDFVEDVGAKLMALLQQFADVPYFVRVTGKEPQEVMQAIQSRPSAQMEGSVTNAQGFTFTKEDIQGEYDLEVVAGSTIPLDKQNTQSILMQTLELAPKLGALPGGPVVGGVGRMLVESLDMPELLRYFDQEAQAQAAQKKEQSQMQETAMEMEVAKEASKRQIDAEKVATKQSDVILKAMEVLKPEPKKPGEKK